MKINSFFCIFLLLFLPLYSKDLIFVQLGESIPFCIFTTIKQARYLNPSSDIYLLTDKKAHRIFQRDHQEFFHDEQIKLIDMSFIPVTKQHAMFYEVNQLLGDFWFYTSERFFTLYDFIKHQDLENVIHLESDTMMYVDLEELLPLFKRANVSLAAPFQSLKGCIPCFVFIKDAESLALLVEHILSELKSYKGAKPHLEINDMQTLASFYRKFGRDYMMPLPTLMSAYSKYHLKRRSNFEGDNATPLSFLSKHEELFPGYIFDAAALGIFINGNDRRYSPNKGSGTIHARSLFNPRFFSFFWDLDNKDKNVPSLSFKGAKYRIVNMHFHSKMPEDYASFNETLGNFPLRKES